MLELKNYIGGKLSPAASGAWLEDFEPATGKVYARVPDSGAADVDGAVAAARAAFPAWSGLPAAERSQWLLKLAGLIERDIEKLARAESVDNGKPLDLARSLDIPAPSPTCASSPPPPASSAASPMPWRKAPSTTPCARRWAPWAASPPGTCRSTCSPGRSRRRSPPVTPWWRSPPK